MRETLAAVIVTAWAAWFTWWVGLQIEDSKKVQQVDRAFFREETVMLRQRMQALEKHAPRKAQPRLLAAERRIEAVCRVIHQMHSMGDICKLPDHPAYSSLAMEE